MKTTTGGDILNLAAELADRTRDNLPTSEATMLRTFISTELPDLWNREAWPELCDNLASVSLDENKCFDLNEGEAGEIGDILGIYDADPRTTTVVSSITNFTRLDNRVNVVTSLASIYVDWQDPAPDMSSLSVSDFAAYELPLRLKLPLALKGAAHLLRTEDPQRAAQYLSMADAELIKQATRLDRPWWRTLRTTTAGAA